MVFRELQQILTLSIFRPLFLTRPCRRNLSDSMFMRLLLILTFSHSGHCSWPGHVGGTWETACPRGYCWYWPWVFSVHCSWPGHVGGTWETACLRGLLLILTLSIFSPLSLTRPCRRNLRDSMSTRLLLILTLSIFSPLFLTRPCRRNLSDSMSTRVTVDTDLEYFQSTVPDQAM